MSSEPTSRAVRRDYQVINNESNNESDISDSSNRRSRRRIEPMQSKLTFALFIKPSIAILDNIQPDKSALQVLTNLFDNLSFVRKLKLSLLYKKEHKFQNKRSKL
jgi:hypothetical protein